MFKPWERICRVYVHFKGGQTDQPIITAEMRAAADVSAKQWNDYQTRFAPFENKFIADVTRDTGVTESAIKGQTNADVQQAMAKQGGAALAGTDPSGATSFSPNAVSKGLAAGYAKTQQDVGNQKVSNLGTAIDMGRGQATQTVGLMSDLGASSGQAALKKATAAAEYDMNERGAYMQLAGQAIGLAGAAAKNMPSGGSVSNQPAGTMTSVSGSRESTGGYGLYDGSNGKQYLLTSGGRYVPYSPN